MHSNTRISRTQRAHLDHVAESYRAIIREAEDAVSLLADPPSEYDYASLCAEVTGVRRRLGRALRQMPKLSEVPQ